MSSRLLYATSVALVAAFLHAPASAQRGVGMPDDTTGIGGAPPLRELVRSSAGGSDLRVIAQRYNADRAALGRRYDIPLSPVLHTRLREFYTGWQRSLQEIDAASLNEAGHADLIALRRRIDDGVAAVDAGERDRAAVTPLLPFLRDLQQLQERRRERRGVDAMETAGAIADVLKEVQRLTAAVESGATSALPAHLRDVPSDVALQAATLIAPAPKSEAVSGTVESGGRNAAAAFVPGGGRGGRASGAGPLRVMLDDWFGYFNGYDPLFSWWVRKPYAELQAALDAYYNAISRRWRPAV